MLEYVQGDILTSDCEAIVNTVNTVGKMGKGLALAFKRAYPDMFVEYQQACYRNEVKVGKMYGWCQMNPVVKWIINFPTKEDWRQPSKMEWIVEGLKDLVRFVDEEGIKSIAIPGLGTGLGGLSYPLVRAEIEKIHDMYWQDIRVVLYTQGKS